MTPMETAEPSAQGSATSPQTAESVETAQQSAPENEGIGKQILLEAEFSNELAGQRNEHENAANRLTVIDRLHLKGTELRVFLHTVQHGSLHGKAAVFVALEFNFIFREDSFRFTSAEILTKWHKRTALAPQPDPKSSRNTKTKPPAPRPLEVISHSPVKIWQSFAGGSKMDLWHCGPSLCDRRYRISRRTAIGRARERLSARPSADHQRLQDQRRRPMGHP